MVAELESKFPRLTWFKEERVMGQKGLYSKC